VFLYRFIGRRKRHFTDEGIDNIIRKRWQRRRRRRKESVREEGTETERKEEEGNCNIP